MASRSSKPVEVGAPWVPPASIVEPEEWPANEPIPAKRRCGFCEWVRRHPILFAIFFLGGFPGSLGFGALAAELAGGDGFFATLNGALAGGMVAGSAAWLWAAALNVIDDVCAPGGPGW